MLPAFTRVFGRGITRVVKTLTTMEKVHPREPHYHLAYVGTRPDQQGRGLGTAVLRPMLDRCDAEGVPAYLENSKPRNEAFYVRHGFVTTGPIPLPAGAPPVMAMCGGTDAADAATREHSAVSVRILITQSATRRTTG